MDTAGDRSAVVPGWPALCAAALPSGTHVDLVAEPCGALALLQRLRGLSKPEFSELPLVFLTADMKSETVELARGLRVDGYLVKPVSLKALKDRVDAALFPAEA